MHKIREENYKAKSFKLVFTDAKGRQKIIEQPLLKNFTFDIKIIDSAEIFTTGSK